MLVVLFISFILIAIWLLLLACGVVSIVLTRRAPGKRSITRLLLAIAPVGICVSIFLTHPELRLNELHFDLGVLFLIPALAGIVAIILWILARQRDGTAV